MLCVASYNVHDCIGRDGDYAPDRIADIVLATGADIVALQEVTLDHAGDLVARLARKTRMQLVDGTLFDRGVGRYGNLLLTRRRVLGETLHDIAVAGREPRGVVDASIDLDGRPVRVLATHLGLASRERRPQFEQLARLLDGASVPVILMGDFNVWLGSCAFAPLRRAGFVSTSVRSYPTWCLPLLPLDRILVRAPAVLARSWRHAQPPAGVASDHFPVVADVQLG